MLTAGMKKNLQKQHYKIVGSHSAVKVCGWTKSSLRGRDKCYKHKFYGIESHKCVQMTSSIGCANKCIFCWRDPRTPAVMDEWKSKTDKPEDIIEGSIKAHLDLISGFGGSAAADRKRLEEAKKPRHVALSLVGESIAYPKFIGLLRKFHEKGISTFVVTRGQHPDKIKKLEKEAPTQLYMSLDAPNKKIFKITDKPLFRDGWERALKSLELLKKLKKSTRTAIRITCIKGINMIEPENYAKLLDIAEPHFVEVKSYMWVGYSRENLEMKNMPIHEETKKFALEIARHANLKLIDESPASRVVLLMKKDFPGRIMKFKSL